MDGVVNNNNSGFASTGVNTSTFSHSLLLNNYDRSVLTGGSTQNVRNAVYFQGTGNKFTRNVVKMTNAEILNAEYGASLGYKHGDTVTTVNSTFEASYNIFKGSAWAVETGESGSHVHHNYAEFRDNFFYLQDVGGPYYPVDSLVEYNTAKGPTLIKIEGFSADAVADNNIFKRNVLVSAVGAYNSEGGVVTDSTYGSDAEYDITSLISVYDYQLNCYYNVGATLVFNHYNSSSGGQVLGGTYSFAQWRAVDVSGSNHKPAWDDDSFNENPVLNTISKATSTNCTNMGYLAGLLGGGGSLPTPTATPSGSPSASATATISATPIPSATGNVGDFNKRSRWSIWD
ncbi:MAG: hypothetical protein BWY21_02279 [Parcubacteria group bacterium ADurb.Bin216]|nr:MAG: hypothetical protein BWY21_02279 [Parcubacteria group bacterium ADurb.Bin216]